LGHAYKLRKFTMHHLHTLFTSRFSAQYKRAYHSSERLFSNSRKPQLTAGLFNHYIENLLENGSSELDLSHFNLTPEIIRQTLPLICHPTSTFRSLKIKQLPLESISHDLIDQLANSPIETLSFDRCKINDEIARTIAHMLKYNNNLRNLVLPHNEISNTGACALAESIAINTILEELDLESNFVGKAGFNSIADALRNNNKTHIKSLNVSGNYISHQEISEFFNGLMGNQSLQTLNVSYNRPYFETSIEDETYSPLPMTETQFGKIIDYLNSNTQLNQLDISGYPLKESAVNQLAYTKHLTHLYAAHCRLGAKGFLCLLNNKRFKKLWLPENGIGYSLIHQAHMPNFKLDTLFIGDCDDKNLHHLLTAGQIDHLVIAFSYLLTDPICAFQQAQLKALDVSFGHTQGIEIQSLGKIKELQHLNLRGSFSDFKSGRVNANDFIHFLWILMKKRLNELYQFQN
jgi:hypothetical protein